MMSYKSDVFDLNAQVKLLHNELERVKNILDEYKKALNMACDTISYGAPKFNDTQYYINLYLQKARAHNEPDS